MIQVCGILRSVEGMNVNKVGVPGAFCVQLASLESEFLRGRFLFFHWDAVEMKARGQGIKDDDLLLLGLNGWPKK
jgi:hypothetical protein